MPELDGPPHDLPRLIEVLDRYEVEYLIVGGAAAYAYGAERPTEDADCVVRRERTNLDRLAGALRELHARLRVGGMTDKDAQALPVQIDATTLDMAGMSTWMTDAGPFDVLAGLEAPDGHLIPYEELVLRATLLYGNGFTIKAAALEDIIRAKERANRAKDREALPELRAIRDASASEDTPPS
jgi:predicted nucleotidyltransferase